MADAEASPNPATAAPATGPLVSVVVRTKDRPALLREALASVATQRWRPLEAIVVNDGGCPVAEVVAGGWPDLPVELVTLDPGRGRATAANAGIRAARGDVVAFLDDDDLFLPDHLATLVAAMQTRGGRVAYAGCRLDRLASGTSEVFAAPFDRDRLLLANTIPTCALVARRDELVAVGGCDETLPFLEDWDLWLRLAERSDFVFVPEVTSVYRVRPGTVGGDMAAERWRAMELLLARHWPKVRPEHVVHRLRTLETEIAAWQTRWATETWPLADLRDSHLVRVVHAVAGLVRWARRATRRSQEPPP